MRCISIEGGGEILSVEEDALCTDSACVFTPSFCTALL